jgi:hypothetical protein
MERTQGAVRLYRVIVHSYTKRGAYTVEGRG